MPLLSQILVPNTGVPSFFSGSGITWPDNRNLQTLPSTGATSPSAYVNDGSVGHSFTKYWTNHPSWGAPDNFNVWFDMGFTPIILSEISGVAGRLVFNIAGQAFNDVTLSGVKLTFKKSNNPSLSNDILFASGNPPNTTMSFGVGTGNSGVQGFRCEIAEVNRLLFPSIGVISLSGQFSIRFNEFQNRSGEFNFIDFDLVLSGSNPNNSCNLYTCGIGYSSGNFNLYQRGLDYSSGTLNLYTQSAGFSSGNMNLFLKGGTASSGNNNLNLFTWSTSNSGLFATKPLFLENASDFADPTHSLNLFVKTIDYGITSSSMNLFINNDTSINSGIPLFLQNSYIGNSGSLNLFITTPSGTENSVPLSGTMNMYIARNSEGAAGVMPMYLKVSDQVNGILNLYMSGANTTTSNVNLYTRGLTSIGYSGIKLNMNGY